MSKRVFITGINGQDGSYLAEYMLELGYEVFGIVRRNSVVENQTTRINHIRNKITLYYGDMIDSVSLKRVLYNVKPDYIFHLAAQSHVQVSFDIPVYTMMVNYQGTQYLLDAYNEICPKARFYNAGSSEMFGVSVDRDLFQRESTPMVPCSPYGVSKVSAFNLTAHYRRAYDLFACSGILFNHESPRRGSSFVTQKVAKTAVEIKLGIADNLELGDLNSARDWGHAWDYVRAMWRLVNHPEPLDLVVATGQAHTVKEMCEYVFGYLGLDYQRYVVSNQKYIRPEELSYLRGDPSKIHILMDWIPKYDFQKLMEEMTKYWLDYYKRYAN